MPREPGAIAVALADKLDQLAAFFAIGEKPTGSGDPYALRRAALGVVRIIRENSLRVPLRVALREAAALCRAGTDLPAELLAFVNDRLRVQLRSEGERHDVLAVAFGRDDDDLHRSLLRVDAIRTLLQTEDGANLLAAYKRAANILRIEERRDGPHDGPVDVALLRHEAEQRLHASLQAASGVQGLLDQERYAEATGVLAGLRAPLDAFFEHVTVNAEDAALRLNRLRLLGSLRGSMNRVADFSVLEG